MDTDPRRLVYLDGAFLPPTEARLSPDDRGFLFADGVYEAVRAYGGRLFGLDAHLERLARSLAALRIGGVDGAAVREVLQRLVRENAVTDGTCYLQVTRGVAPRAHPFPPAGTPPTVYAFAVPLRADREKWARGVAVTLVPDLRWARCDVKTTALTANVLAAQAAVESGVEEAVFVRDGVVTEGAHTNVAAVFDGVLWTHPEGPYILPGVTRRYVLGLCERLGLPYVLRPFRADDLARANEVMLLSTSSEVLPVVRVDDRAIGDG
ncbi:MAG TPA: aminotransferase class IV, partial [Anaeromyxobacteraceae bacterium]|nr:aminotransferase class IV [Anaeromyxobacteraceae bacterium]